MTDSIQVAAFEGGELRLLSEDLDSHEAVLALPLSRMIIKMVRVPAENREDPVAYATPVLQSMSPYPDEPLTVSCETVREDGAGLVVLAAALPESACDDVAEALDARKLNVMRVDTLALGQIRGIWGRLGVEDGARRLVMMAGKECLSAFVLDGDSPVVIRAVNGEAEIKREVMLMLLEAEDFGGAKPLGEIVWIGAEAPVELESFAPVRCLEIGEDAGLVGVAERSKDETSLNALPASWREVLEETRFKKKLMMRMSIAGGVWALIMVVLFGVPLVFGFMTDRQKALCKEHSRKFQEVSRIKEKVELVQKYSDHDRGALEIMKAVSDRLPAGIDLDSWNFRRGEGLKISGLADENNSVYDFKDAIDAIECGEGDGAEKLFKVVQLGNISNSRGKYKFPLDLAYEKEDEE